MNDLELRQRINAIFRDVFDDETLEIHEAMTAKDVEGWDSLNHINLIVAIERALKVKFTTREVGRLANVGELLALIKGKLPT
jgi:acyl carrier protein